MANCLKICSYNSQGHGPGRLEYIQKLCTDHHFVLIQEHWLHESDTHWFNNNIPNISSHVVSGMDRYSMLEGRPFGGCAILWPNNLNLKVTPIISNCKRLCVVSIAIENVNVVLCNLYLPSSCANHSDKLSEYSETLNTVSGLLVELEFDYVIVGGDLNTDFRRLGSKAVTLFESFMLKESLQIFSSDNNQIDYTFQSKIDGSESIIDHFVGCNNVSNITSEYCVLHSCDNLSDHSAISISVAISVESFNIVMDQSTNLLWNTVTQHELNLYQNTIDKKLNNVSMLKDVFSCHNFCCTNSGHINHLKTLYNDLKQIMLDAGNACIPNTLPKTQVKAKPGWNSYVEDYRCTSLLWHKIWSDCGKPRTGTVADIMRKTRANYHHAIKLIKKQKDDIIADKMAKGLLQERNVNFWKEFRKKKCNRIKLPSFIDGVLGEQKICEIFSEKYKTLYNSVSYKCHEMIDLEHEVKSAVSCGCVQERCYSSHAVTVHEVTSAIKKT